MSRKNTKKIGYKRYEELLAQAYQRLEFLGSKFQELQAYMIAYIEFKGDNINFNEWMAARIKEMGVNMKKSEEKKEHANEEV